MTQFTVFGLVFIVKRANAKDYNAFYSILGFDYCLLRYLLNITVQI
jgi:hypothetical protein